MKTLLVISTIILAGCIPQNQRSPKEGQYLIDGCYRDLVYKSCTRNISSNDLYDGKLPERYKDQCMKKATKMAYLKSINSKPSCNIVSVKP